MIPALERSSDIEDEPIKWGTVIEIAYDSFRVARKWIMQLSWYLCAS